MRVGMNTGQGPAARRHAFTLVEASVALLILGVMLLALYAGLTWCTASVRIARENLRATQIMVEKMEVIRLLTWDQLNSTNVLPTRFTAPYAATSVSSKNNTNNQNFTVTNSGGFLYYGTIKIVPPLETQLLAGYTNDMRVVSVEINWTNRSQPHARKIKSYVSRYGIQNYAIN